VERGETIGAGMSEKILERWIKKFESQNRIARMCYQPLRPKVVILKEVGQETLLLKEY